MSYSHDDAAHIAAVHQLSDRLRTDGIDCVLDQYEHSPPEGWPRWMDAKIRTSKYVLMICTEAYCRRVMGSELPGVGHGVRWEGTLIYQHIYDAGTQNTKFIPVVLKKADRVHVPTPVRGATVYSLEEPSGYDSLYRRLAEIPPAKASLGPRRPLAAKPVLTNPSAFITGPIDVELWNKAGWRATFYSEDSDGVPILGLAFRDREAAEAIFRGWHVRYGDRDEEEELRVSIVEGHIPGRDSGYSVYITTDSDVFISRVKRAGYAYDESDSIFTVGRVQRMNADPGSPHLRRFKEAYRRFKTYWLVPGVIDSHGRVQAIPQLRIFKSRVVFKDVAEIHPQDPDYAVLVKESN